MRGSSFVSVNIYLLRRCLLLSCCRCTASAGVGSSGHRASGDLEDWIRESFLAKSPRMRCGLTSTTQGARQDSGTSVVSLELAGGGTRDSENRRLQQAQISNPLRHNFPGRVIYGRSHISNGLISRQQVIGDSLFRFWIFVVVWGFAELNR
jgi:hypothetical protein